MSEPIQGLWIGPRLSAMERLSIRSFLDHGHPYHLYVYDPVREVPAGAVLKDASEILPPERIFRYRDEGSYAGFANFFRYKLLLERGGWWADTDVVCLKPFRFAHARVYSGEATREGEVVNNGVIRAPAGCAVMALAWRACRRADPSRLEWGETGPRLMLRLIRRLGLAHRVQPAAAFCPLAWWHWDHVLDPSREWAFGPEAYAIHLWNEMWRRAGCDKDRRYPDACLYQRLRVRHRVD